MNVTEAERSKKLDPYKVLDVEPNATPAEVRLAYVQKVREHPPEHDPEGFKPGEGGLRDPAVAAKTG